MDPRLNPYTPNAGASPPVLVGRDDQLASFGLLLERLRRGRTEQSMLITGLRGVGKTVLLSRFREEAESAGWAVVELEARKHDDTAFRHELALGFRRALFQIAPKERWKDRVQRAAATLRSFTIRVDPNGNLTAGLGVEPAEGLADTGLLDIDLADLVVVMGEAAREHDTGVVLLLDEIQFLDRRQLEAVIVALHRAVQRSLPITLVGAGLPQVPELAGEAKSYAERLFKFPAIGNLSTADAATALAEPAINQGVEFEDAAIRNAIEFTEGYPYFLQELGYAVWTLATNGRVRGRDVNEARRVVEEKLDQSFFRIRLDRTTDLEQAYLRAMAELGPQPQLAGDVAKLLKRTSQQCGPTRSQLIEKGLLYTPNHGYAAFTVPHFDRFMRRTLPELRIPPVRKRAKSKPRKVS
jgi:hypothetical protein